MTEMLSLNLITKWNNHQPESHLVDYLDLKLSNPFDNSLFGYYKANESKPACGNSHAGVGKFRIIKNEFESHFSDQKEILQELENSIPELGDRILISAGHFMPLKSNFLKVNSNSYESLIYGIKILSKILDMGKQADLLITINDVTINSIDEQDDDLPTLSSFQRQKFYESLTLPSIYISSLLELEVAYSGRFKIFVIGENKLSEKLSKDANVLTNSGLFKRPVNNRKCYSLSIDNHKIENFIKLAHGKSTEIKDFYDINNPIIISNESGIKGRPKCVRACMRLAALPFEMNYSGFLQFLPVCSRNALEGYLIGNYIYSKFFHKTMPFISIHNVYSCF